MVQMELYLTPIEHAAYWGGYNQDKIFFQSCESAFSKFGKVYWVTDDLHHSSRKEWECQVSHQHILTEGLQGTPSPIQTCSSDIKSDSMAFKEHVQNSLKEYVLKRNCGVLCCQKLGQCQGLLLVGSVLF